MNRTYDQKHFKILEAAADWHKLMIPQRIRRPSIALASERLDGTHGAASTHSLTLPLSTALSFYTVARELLLISRPSENRRLSHRIYLASEREE